MTAGEYIEQQYENSNLFTNLKEDTTMITLDQAIELATQAHEGQWRNPINASITDFESERKEILKSGGSYILKNGSHVYEDEDDKYIWKIQKPYITHPLAVMAMMDTDEEKIVAVLHDVFEDTKWSIHFGAREVEYLKSKSYYRIALMKVIDKKLETEREIKGYDITQVIYKALKLLTKTKNQNYEKYIRDISKNKLATKVKIADIVCNLSDNPSEHAKQKYLKALPILLKGI